MNPMDHKRGVSTKPSLPLFEELKAHYRALTLKAITRVGTISANSDDETVGKAIAEAMDKVGKEA